METSEESVLLSISKKEEEFFVNFSWKGTNHEQFMERNVADTGSRDTFFSFNCELVNQVIDMEYVL